MRAQAQSRSTSQAGVSQHAPVIIICLAVLFLSIILRIGPHGNIVLNSPHVVLPSACLYKHIVGSPCPGCGMTHSFIALAKGNLKQALGYHPIGPFLYAFVLLQLAFRAYGAFRPRVGDSLLKGPVTQYYLRFLVIALVINWLLRLFWPGYPL